MRNRIIKNIIIKKMFAILLFVFIFFQKGRSEVQNVNMLFVNENTNNIAEKSVQTAMQYIKRNPSLEVQVNMKTVNGSNNKSKVLLDSLCETYKEMLASKSPPHVILDTTTLGLASETVKYFSSSLGLPTISGSFGQYGDLREWRNITYNEEKYLIQIIPPADVVTDIVKAFVMSLKIPNLAILYDRHFVLEHKLKTLLQNISTRHLIGQVDLENIISQLKNFKHQEIANFFVFGNMTTIRLVLEAADSLSLLTRKDAWHVITLSNKELECNCKNVTILFAQPELSTTRRLEGIKNVYNFNEEPTIMSAFYFDLTLFTVLTVRDMIKANDWPNMEHTSCEDFNPESKPIRNNLNLKKYFSTKFSEPPSYKSFDIISNGWSQMEFNMNLSAVTIRNNVVENIKQLGVWTSKFNNNFTLFNSDSDPDLMDSYINDKFYRVVTMEQKPFVYIDKTAPQGFKGYCIDLMELIAKYCNIRYEIHLVADRKFGDIDKNGEWNGMVRDLMDNKADIALGSLSITSERENVIDFTVPYYEGVGITVMTKRHLPSRSLFKFLSVLEIEVWLCILAAYMFTSLIIWTFDRFSPLSYQNNISKYENSDETRLFTLKECFWFCITSLTPQGGGEAPKSPSGRMIAATWWLFGFIIISSYTANLAAFLTVTRLGNPVSSLNELSQQYKVTYAPVEGSMAMQYFERMANIEKTFYEIWENMFLNSTLSYLEQSKLSIWEYPISDKYTKMWNSMKQTGMPTSHEEAVQRVRDSISESDGFAYIGDGIDLKYLALVNCELQVIGEEFSKKPLAIGVQKNSPLKMQISNAIMELMVRRKLELLKHKWWIDNSDAQICTEESILIGGISIQNIAGVFIVVFIGISLACIALFIENRKKKYQEKRHNLTSTKRTGGL